MNAQPNWFSIQCTPDTKGGVSSSPASSVSSFSTFRVLAYGLDLSKRLASVCRIRMHIQGADFRDSGRWVHAPALLSSHKQIKGLKRVASSEVKSTCWWLCSSARRQLQGCSSCCLHYFTIICKIPKQSLQKMVLPSPQCRKHFRSLNATFQETPTETLGKRPKLMRHRMKSCLPLI